MPAIINLKKEIGLIYCIIEIKKKSNNYGSIGNFLSSFAVILYRWINLCNTKIKNY
jgi:hypothetical protein